MISAVARARCRSDDHTDALEPWATVVASASASSTAPRTPSSLSGGSAWPCQRRSRFHVDSPWRTQSRWTDTGTVVASAARATVLGTLAPWRSCACSPRPARPPARVATTLPGATVGDVLGAAGERYGRAFADVLPTCRIWVNGDPPPTPPTVGPNDEVAVLPPVSGGAA